MTQTTMLEEMMLKHNVNPWFIKDYDTITTFDEALWYKAIMAIKNPDNVAYDPRALCIVRPETTFFGAGEIGMKYITDSKYNYLPMPWSNKVIILTPDVLVLVRTSRTFEDHLREIVKEWLYLSGINVSYDPATNDMLINKKKFMGVQSFDAPVGWRTEFAMLTVHKDDELFDSALPSEFKTSGMGKNGITGICDEVGFDIDRALPDLYRINKGELYDY